MENALALFSVTILLGLLVCIFLADAGPRHLGPSQRYRGAAMLEEKSAGAKSSGAVESAFSSSCKLSNWVGLGKCRKGMNEPGCSEAYDEWFQAGCLCDYKAYPWGFLPKDITPVGFTWALMQTRRPHTYQELTAHAPCLESLRDCRAPHDGDVRLDVYGHGTLLVFHEQVWRPVLGQLSNESASTQCLRLGFKEGYAAEGAEPSAHPQAEGPELYVDGACLGTEPLQHCLRHTRRPDNSTSSAMRAVRVGCSSVGPAGCFVSRTGLPVCVVGPARFTEQAALGHTPSLACGTAGTRFLERPPVVVAPEEHGEGGRGTEAGCLALLDGAKARCELSPGESSRSDASRALERERHRMCSSACHDSVLQAIRREDCFELAVNSSWGATYGQALKDHAESVYSHCGQDLWQSAVLSAEIYEGCVGVLLDMFRRCQEDSEKHLCSNSCGEKVDEAMSADERCHSVHYYRGESRVYRGHVSLLAELRERVCVWPDLGELDELLSASGRER